MGRGIKEVVILEQLFLKMRRYTYFLEHIKNLSGNVVQDQAEHIMLNKEGVGVGLEDKGLSEGLRRVFVRLQLAQDVDHDPAVKGRLAIDGRDDVGNLLKGQRRNLLHDLGRSLHLLSFEGH